MINVGFHSARLSAGRRRRRFLQALERPGYLADLRERYNPTPLPARLVTFSGQRDLAEQAASLLSLFLHAGQPEAIIVGSDGSHDAAAEALLRQLHPRLRLQPWSQLAPEPLPPVLRHHAEQHPLGKKLALILGQAALACPQTPLLYADSDILFFPAAASALPDWLRHRPPVDGRFLLDCQPALDPRLLQPGDPTEVPLNSGLLILHRALNADLALQRLEQLWRDTPDAPADHYSEQTALHLSLPIPRYLPLPHHSCVVFIHDQFLHSDQIRNDPRLVLRHYVTIVRHHFWRAVPEVLANNTLSIANT